MENSTTLLPPKVVHVYKSKFDLYIGRKWAEFPKSKWHNPFHLKNKWDEVERRKVLSQYREYVLDSPELMAALPELAGLRLGCWCYPQCCHGDILVELFNQFILNKAA